ncbi:inverted formin-2-like [Sceloporus undulatus]|uniref:inverted formin-2-like n=1 Tax=Sceloporus undulatus TaxID=8520 RepID=UPI001C4C1AA0|nr:inverted formin-2-like [Sceloporus undulatus]
MALDWVLPLFILLDASASANDLLLSRPGKGRPLGRLTGTVPPKGGGEGLEPGPGCSSAPERRLLSLQRSPSRPLPPAQSLLLPPPMAGRPGFPLTPPLERLPSMAHSAPLPPPPPAGLLRGGPSRRQPIPAYGARGPLPR